MGRFDGWGGKPKPKEPRRSRAKVVLTTNLTTPLVGSADPARPLVVGVDPDKAASGVAIRNQVTGEASVQVWDFWKLCEYLATHASALRLVVIEGGWLNTKSNFRHDHQVREAQQKARGSASALATLLLQVILVSCKIAKNVGHNEQTGQLLVALCERRGIPYRVVQPTTSKETSARTFAARTGLTKTNQEERDAWNLIENL